MAEKKRKKKKKKTTAGDILRNVILIAALLVFLFSGYQLFGIFMEYKKGSDEYDKIREYAVSEEKEEPDKEKEEEKTEAEEGEEVLPNPPKVNFEALQKVNPDVVGWLEIETLDISYPIVKGEDNEHYLHYTFEGNQNAAGSIFMDYNNKSDFQDCNTIIYGHNMKNESMFGKFRTLHKQENLTSPYIWVCTPQGSYRYEIFTVHTTSASGDTYTLFSAPCQEFTEYLENRKKESELTLDAVPSGEDKIITLSTCTGNDATRFVIQAKRLPEVYE